MKNLILTASLLIAGAMASCQQEAETADVNQTTRTYGTKTPIVAIYVETNDVNPLNAGDYLLSDGTTYADIVEFFASNIHAETVDGVVRPTLYLNDKMTNLLENGGAATYVKGLQDKGIKVLLTVLGDWQHIGVASMNDTQAEQFATILAYAVEKYGLDGIGFDDEYADYTTLESGSYGNVITKLHNLMPSDKLITIFQYGNIGPSQIDAEAGALLNYDYANFGYSTNIGIEGVTKEHYAPLSINLGYTYSTTQLNQYRLQANDTATDGFGAIMHFNLRTLSNVSPLPVFNAIAGGAYNETVTVATEPSNAGDRPQDWTFVPEGYTITYDEATGSAK